MPKPDVRQEELAKIHIAKKELGLDDDTYRAMLTQVIEVDKARRLSVEGIKMYYNGVVSAKGLSAAGRAAVLEHLKASGFKGKKTYAKRPHTTDNKAQLLKIEALLADMGLPWDYLTARQQGKDGKTLSMVERLTGIKRLEWCNKTQLSKVIAALAIHQKKLNKEEK